MTIRNKLTIGIALSLAVTLSGCTPEPGENAGDQYPSVSKYQVTTTTAAPTDGPLAYKSRLELRRTIALREVTNAYRESDMIPPSELELDEVASEICQDIKANGEGRFYYPDLTKDEFEEELATALNYAFATTTACNRASDYQLGNTLRAALHSAQDGATFDLSVLLSDPSEEAEKPILIVNPDGTYDVNESQLYLPGYRRNGNSGGGYPVTCADGTTSYAGGKQGACSWHGGTK